MRDPRPEQRSQRLGVFLALWFGRRLMSTLRPRQAARPRAGPRLAAVISVLVFGTCLLGTFLAGTSTVESAQLSAPPPPAAPAPAVKAQEPPPEDVQEPALQFPIELLASRPIVRVKINGQGPFAFLIDPLAPRATIDQTLVEALELKSHPSASGRTEVQIDLGLGPDTLKNVVAEIANTTRLVAEFGPGGQPRGVLGASLWTGQLVTIDFGRRRLRILAGALPEPNGKDVFALQGPSQDLVVPLTVSGRSLTCQVNPMASHGLLLPARSLTELPIAKPSISAARIHFRDAILTGKEARLTSLVTIATFDFDQPIVEFAEIGDVAIVGSRWLVDLALTYDLANGRVRLERLRKS